MSGDLLYRTVLEILREHCLSTQAIRRDGRWHCTGCGWRSERGLPSWSDQQTKHQAEMVARDLSATHMCTRTIDLNTPASQIGDIYACQCGRQWKLVRDGKWALLTWGAVQ